MPFVMRLLLIDPIDSHPDETSRLHTVLAVRSLNVNSFSTTRLKFGYRSADTLTAQTKGLHHSQDLYIHAISVP